MKDVSWRATHVKFKDLEEAAGHRLSRFDDIRNGISGITLSIGIPFYEWEKYGITKAVKRLGLSNKSCIYINF